MMTNLFSSFDPSTGLFSMNWMSSMIWIIFIPMSYWYIPNRYFNMYSKLFLMLKNELDTLMCKNSLGTSLIMCSLFIFILLNNSMGLFPYVFTSSSHLVFAMSLALPMWMSFILFGFLINSSHMFCHLVPMGTPMILMPFMVCIETISNLIRPGSLAVRLTANMIAGHLLMTLLGNSSFNSGIFINMILLIQMLLIVFELAVSFIQSYVFTVLSTLYYSEVM
uniref:ATP synthase subunit a n=1 Tax=Muda kuroiwae TaxID=2170272 RepID=A0A344ALU7_9HEMI|nr:ATP synthase F0 subunit 6 [Muda kuroiwae]